MDLSLLTVITAVLVGCTIFSVIEHFKARRLARNFAKELALLDLAMRNMNDIFSKVLIDEGLSEGVQLKNGQYLLFPKGTPPELKRRISSLGTHMPKGGGSNTDSQSEKPNNME